MEVANDAGDLEVAAGASGRRGAGCTARVIKVAVDATPLLGQRTGVGEFCSGILRAMAGMEELDVSAFAVSWRRRGELVPLLPQGIAALQHPMPARPMHWLWRAASRPAVEWWVGHPDVVHGTNYVVPPTRRAARVVSIHDLSTVKYPELCEQATLVFPALMRSAIADGAWVVVPSSFVASEVQESLGAAQDRVRVVPYGVPTARAAASNAEGLDGALAKEPESVASLPGWVRRYILALGTLEPRKDLPSLVQAFDAIAGERKDLALVVAGRDGWGAGAFDEAVSRARFSGQVLRLGYVSEADRDQLLAGAAVFAYPSLYEGFGFPPLEAMRAGVPVVATTAGSLPEVVGGAAITVEPGDVDALAGALEMLLDSSEVRSRLIAMGKARSAELTWDRCARGLLDVYRAATVQSS